ncbi:MAG TPA: hypothetical protein VET27_25300 [Mycobacterium sp.]|nr:hypothetical protein [Mycobacterium sp.]
MPRPRAGWAVEELPITPAQFAAVIATAVADTAAVVRTRQERS